MEALFKLLAKRTAADEGQTLVEYSLILALVSIGSIAVLLALSGKINDVFTTITGVL